MERIMGKRKKDGRYISLYIDTAVANELEEYCEAMGQTKTTAIERILHKHFTEWKEANESSKDK